MKIDDKKTFLVTGGASGLGEAVVRRLHQLGAYVIICDVNDTSGKALEADLNTKRSGSSVFATTDVCDEVSVANALECRKKVGSGDLHGVLNVAGIASAQLVVARNGSVHSLADFNKVLAVNVSGTFNVTRLATAVMATQRQKQGGTDQKSAGSTGKPPVESYAIINVASVAAFEGQVGQAAYAASKGAVVSLTLPLARELSRFGIRVVCIAPGIFLTPMMKSLPAKAQESLSKQVPYPPRLGAPEEFAQLCESILTNEYLNGEVIRIDGSIRMSAL